MASEPIGADDLAVVADQGETATLLRGRGGGSVAASVAVRVGTTSAEATPSGGAVVESAADWLVEMPAGESAIEPGDVLRDAKGERWTVLTVRFVAALSRYRCTTSNLRVAFGLDDRVDVLRPQWQDSGSGPEIVGWDYVATAQPVRLQPLAATLDETASPPTAVEQFTAIFAELLPIQPGDRLATDDGARYVVQRFEHAERIDALPTATVTRETA
ncbi:MAG: hypothetical protein CMJ58_26565 [Planctomycetaceae bacterium]|nr:hypothetical protein [Planctomycetaceae bacterium]